MKNRNLFGVYIVTEGGCLNSKTGASRHIKIGIEKLGKHFSIDPILPTNKVKENSTKSSESISQKLKNLNNPIFGFFRDLKYFSKNTIKAFSYLRDIKNKKPDFVYIRSHFLDPLPFLLYIIKIPVFVESNGLQFDGRKKYYRSLLESLNKRFEYLMYSVSNHVFFIGSYGDYWKLKKKNWSNIENGVEHEFLNMFSSHEKSIKGKIHLALIAKLMAHHQPQILILAIKELDSITRSKLCLHLIGSGLDIIKAEIQEYIEVIDHGFLDREQLAACLKQIHAGLIPGVPEYQSQMKLFDYGAAKCVAIVPKVHNLDYWFNDSEVEFFEPDNSVSLAKTITKIADDPERLFPKGENLHQRISREFTWDKIFSKKASTIKNNLIKN